MTVDRRALLIGYWGPDEEPGPSHQKIRGLLARWERALALEGSYPFAALDNPAGSPVAYANPGRSHITQFLSETAVGVDANTLLFLYYVGHSRGHGENDIDLLLRYDRKLDKRFHISLRRLLEEVAEAGFRKLILIIDSCHAGRSKHRINQFPHSYYAILSTGSAYAFDATFSERLLSTLERQPQRNDQRIDRKRQGFTYKKLFEVARAGFLRVSSGDKANSQQPDAFGNLGDEVIAHAPVAIPTAYNDFAGERTIYGRVFKMLSLIGSDPTTLPILFDNVKKESAFVIRRGEERNVCLGSERLKVYLEFLRRVGFVDLRNERVTLTKNGEKAAKRDYYNKELSYAIEERLFPEDLSIDKLEEIVKDLLEDMMPSTPSKIQERVQMKGIMFTLDDVIRLALALLPSTGRFMKGAADTLYPSESSLLQNSAES
jgi:hypothetical protein